jgi:pSer/pThr/pTyr-binding forkhead associated (FHA) protein
MLKIQLKDQQQEPIWIVEEIYTIGSDIKDNLCLQDDALSAHHAEILTKGNKLFLNTLSPKPACGINGQDMNTGEIRPGDTVHIGKNELLILHPYDSITQSALNDDAIPKWSLTATGDWLEGQNFAIPKLKSTIGRSQHCDIVIPGTHLSRQHAELSINGNLLFIKDLASSNGTYINGKRISEGTARAGDEINFDVYLFRLNGPNTDLNRTQVRKPLEPPLRKPNPSLNKPKNWVTKPTSPGNREEAIPPAARLPFIASLILCLAMTAAIIYLGSI